MDPCVDRVVTPGHILVHPWKVAVAAERIANDDLLEEVILVPAHLILDRHLRAQIPVHDHGPDRSPDLPLGQGPDHVAAARECSHLRLQEGIQEENLIREAQMVEALKRPALM